MKTFFFLLPHRGNIQVCRFFLSSLMLANTGNVEISRGETLPDEDCVLERLSSAMDQYKLSLLSTTRHHEQLSDFQVNSLIL